MRPPLPPRREPPGVDEGVKFMSWALIGCLIWLSILAAIVFHFSTVT